LLLSTSRENLGEVAQELTQQVPDPMHSMLEKESKEEAIQKHKERKEETAIYPPTCTG